MMTPTGHNKILGILHLAYGGLSALIMLGVAIFLLVIRDLEGEAGRPMPGGVFALVMMALLVMAVVQVTPSFLAGYALLKRKRWAKTMGIIGAMVAGLSFPLGTALCVYTLWFLFGDSGKFLYHKAAYALPPGEASWGKAVAREPVREYVPPSAPPDWR
jgi:hypothetical protein